MEVGEPTPQLASEAPLPQEAPPPTPPEGSPPQTPPEGSPSIQVGARRATLDIGTQVIGRIGNLALGVVVTSVIARMLGGSGFGEWSTIFAITQIAANFGELGLTQVAVSRAASEPPRQGEWLGALLSLRVLLAVPTTILALVGVLLIVSTRSAEIAGVLVAATILVNAPMALSAVFQLRVRNDVTIAIMTLGSVLWTAGALAVALTSKSIVALAAVFLAVAAITTCLTILRARRLVSLRPVSARRLWPALMRVGLGVGAAGILVTLYVKLDQVLVFELAGSHQAGLYGAAYRVLDQIQFIPISVMTTLFPLIATAYPRDRERVRRLLQSAGEYLTMGSLPVLAFTVVAAAPIVRLLFGAQFAQAAPALPILMGAFVSISFGYLAGNMVVILELQRRFFIYALVGLLLNASLNVALIPRYGFLAAAWITLATEVVVMSLTMHSVLRKLAMTPRVVRLARTLVAATGMGLLTWLAQGLGAPLLGLLAVAALTYPALLLSLRALSVAEVRAVLRKEPL
jgi:O-antigen/teichoic acid export membrane protein